MCDWLDFAVAKSRVFHVYRCEHWSRLEHWNRLSFEDYCFMPFGGKLSGDHRGVTLADLNPWDELETTMRRRFASAKECPPSHSE